jgi:ABC-type dipeptide/oligopeptide/nickel transport system permease component
VGRYIVRRLLQMIPVLLVATMAIYYLNFALPGDPIRALGGDRPLPPDIISGLRDRYNLDDPFLVQYFKWLGGILTGDLGETFRGQEVSQILRERWPVTIRLALLALLFEAVFGILLGVAAALRRNSRFDNISLGATTLLIAVPTFVLAFTAQYVFGVKLGWFPVAGISDGFSSYILPAMVLAALSLAYVMRLTRTSMLENLRSDFRRTAIAKGLPEGQVTRKHVLRNSLIPVITFLATDLGALMGGAIVTEGVFNIPGVGNALFQAIRLQEGTTVVGISVVLILIYLFANLAADIIVAFLDPRIRYE